MHGKTPTDTPVHGNASVVPDRLFNSRETRELLGGISESTFRRLTSTGRLKAKKQGVSVYVPQSAIDEYIASLPEVAPATAAAPAA